MKFIKMERGDKMKKLPKLKHYKLNKSTDSAPSVPLGDGVQPPTHQSGDELSEPKIHLYQH